jgi:hypothetical protein
MGNATLDRMSSRKLLQQALGLQNGPRIIHSTGPARVYYSPMTRQPLMPAPVCPWLQASRLTLVQILINSQGLNMNPLQSLYYISPACLAGLAIPFCEPPRPRPRFRIGKTLKLHGRPIPACESQ